MNSSVIGTDTVVYTAVDPAGNTTVRYLTVIVGREPEADWQVAAQQNLSFSFQDLSLYSPNKWTWTFGDGGNPSPQPNPNKIYSASGTYNVCLKAENRFNLAPFNKVASEKCEDVVISGIADRNVLDAAVAIFPNPSTGLVNVEISETNASSLKVEITNLLGEVISTREITEVNGKEVLSFNLENNASGIYFVNISSSNASISKRIVLQ
ncbi:MAG: T9SS type A sorting domain-containing protein [Chitinophagales bacterium]